MGLSKEDLHFIKTFCEKEEMKSLSDHEISKELTKYKRFKDYDFTSIETVRRSVSFIRKFFDMRHDPKKDMAKHIESLYKENPSATKKAVAIRLHEFYPKFSLITLRQIVINYTLYGHITS